MLHRIVSPRLRVCLSRSLFISPSNSLLKIQQRKNSHNEEKSEQIPDSFFSDCWKLTKTIFPIALAIFIVKQIFFVPIIGRSMCPQFNPGVADYGDTVLFVPRLFRATPLVRGNIYLFTDPSNRKIQAGDTNYIVKRCIAIEGDKVMVEKNDTVDFIEIPEGHCWLESDNWSYQAGEYPDSLKFGPISNNLVWGKVVYCYRRNNIFPTFYPRPQNYEFYVKLEKAIPHQRIILSRKTPNPTYKAIGEMQNLPNKQGMNLLPKGKSDIKMEDWTEQEKMGWSYDHNFSLSTDIKFIENLQAKNLKALEDDERKRMIPGTSISEKGNEKN